MSHTHRRAFLVAALDDAEGSRAVAAALACAAAGERSALLIDLGAAQPRPTLLCSAPAQALERRLGALLPGVQPAARGQLCQIAVPADQRGLDVVASARPEVLDVPVIVHLPQRLLDTVLGSELPDPTGVLLRADSEHPDSTAAALVTRLLRQGLAVAVLTERMSWVAERRAQFGSLPPNGPGGLPLRIVREILETP